MNEERRKQIDVADVRFAPGANQDIGSTAEKR